MTAPLHSYAALQTMVRTGALNVPVIGIAKSGWTVEQLRARVVRGQFRGYQDEPGVAAGSRVETFAALRLRIDAWRWADVPFFLRAGKCLPTSAFEVRVQLKRPPRDIYREGSASFEYFRCRVGPDVAALALVAAVPGSWQRPIDPRTAP